MIDRDTAILGRLADNWSAEGTRRRHLSAHDPLADVLDYCASELRDRLQEIARDARYLSPEEYARDHRVTPQTVRGWIRTGQLEAVRTGKGWQVPRLAERRLRKSA